MGVYLFRIGDRVDAVHMKTTLHTPNIAGPVTALHGPDRATGASPLSWARMVGAFRQRHSQPDQGLAPSSIELRDNETTRFAPRCSGSSIEVRRGIVWLTGSAAEGDIILREGERHALRSRTAYVAQAIGDAEAVLSAAH